ncbi:hypothetical protein FSW04_05220 [Baekduia soli]|uniref:Uncharacterized protein n=1 Tax=Baekduia soli TaxID=496014 RepID=A0A5B8U1V2_9ACTN|nr:hypothetical protein [Baekduia soli]QEC47044.1 hypothetical protein FSW04_05220 [Baekduia soli]
MTLARAWTVHWYEDDGWGNAVRERPTSLSELLALYPGARDLLIERHVEVLRNAERSVAVAAEHIARHRADLEGQAR